MSVRELTAVVDEEAARTGELVSLSRQHPQGQLLVTHLGVRKIQFGLESINIVSEIGGSPGTLCLQRLQALLLEFVVLDVSAPPGVEVTSH